MKDLLAQNNGQLFTDFRASKLLTDDSGAVVGAMATDATGKEVTINAKSVVLATGSFGANQKLLPETLNGYLFYGRDSDTGDLASKAEEHTADVGYCQRSFRRKA